MCQARFDAEAMFRDYLLRRPDERKKLTDEEADYYGFRRDPASGLWVDAWTARSPAADVSEPTAQ
jgi:hypothetical protein